MPALLQIHTRKEQPAPHPLLDTKLFSIWALAQSFKIQILIKQSRSSHAQDIRRAVKFIHLTHLHHDLSANGPPIRQPIDTHRSLVSLACLLAFVPISPLAMRSTKFVPTSKSQPAPSTQMTDKMLFASFDLIARFQFLRDVTCRKKENGK